MRKNIISRITHILISVTLIVSMLLPNTDFLGIEVEASTSSLEKEIYDLFKAKGYTDAGIAGILGNLYCESAYMPYRLGNVSVQKGGYGDKGQTFTAQVDNFEISYEEFQKSSTLGQDTTLQYGYGLPMWYHYTVKAALYNYWKKYYWTTVDETDENGQPVVDEQGVSVKKTVATKSIGSMEVQVNYLHTYMLNTLKDMYDGTNHTLATEFKKTNDPYKSAVLFHNCVEKSAGTTIAKRINKSISVYNSYSNANSIVKVTTNSHTGVTDTTAGINASYANAGAQNITSFAVIYGTNVGNMKQTQTFTCSTSKTSGTFATKTITGLNANTTYYYIPVAYVGTQPYYGTVSSFTTAQSTSPGGNETVEPDPGTDSGTTDGKFTLSTRAAANITETSVDVCFDYTNPGGITVTQYGFEIGTSTSNMAVASGSPYTSNITKASGYILTRTITGLKKGTKYYFRPYAISGSSKYYGDIKSFTTSGTAETATYATISSYTYPTSLNEGDSFTITGTISSTTNITSVEVDILDSTGAKYISKVDSPNTKTYDLKTSMSSYINFKYVPAGTYKYVVKATNSAGTKTLVSKEFVVNAAPAHTHAGTKVALKAATMTANGTKAYYKCSCGKLFSDSACTKEISAPTTIYKASTVKLEKTSYTYDGNAKTPAVIVQDSKGNTISTSYYTVTKASGRVNVGSYTYKITFKGNYSGTKELTFKINPKGTTQNTPVGGTKSFTAKWTKQSTLMKTSRITGYQVQYSRVSDFSSYTGTKTVSGYSKTSVTVTSLTAKKYYIRIRTYKTVNNVKYYSPWSSVKTVSIK